MDNKIDWLVQEIADYPRIAEGAAPPGLLSKSETARLETLTVNKRRRDWLLGRLTAKQLLQTVLQDATGQSVQLDQIVIENDAEGAPFALLTAERLGYSLSISHSNGAAFCAVHRECTVGVDMERIETRDLELRALLLHAIRDRTGRGRTPGTARSVVHGHLEWKGSCAQSAARGLASRHTNHRMPL